MLKKKNRLTRKEFEEVFKKGKKSFSANFLLIVLEKENQKKISVVVSKKVEKGAVKRIKSRRIVYKILQENFNRIPENI
jgi:ribonuclease P protein component